MGRRYKRSLRRREDREEINPMDGLGNMADVMLVLAVGIMLALISHWNIDVSTSDKLVNVQDATEVKNMETLDEEDIQAVEEDAALQERGVVYLDPQSGKYYMKIEGE